MKGGIADQLMNLGRVAGYQGDYAAAHSLLAESLTLSQDLGHTKFIGLALERFTGLAAVQRQAGRAMRLDGAAAKLSAALGTPSPALESELLERRLHTARQMLGEDAAAEAREQGLAMRLGLKL
jgi:hypothetical protein